MGRLYDVLAVVSVVVLTLMAVSGKWEGMVVVFLANVLFLANERRGGRLDERVTEGLVIPSG